MRLRISRTPHSAMRGVRSGERQPVPIARDERQRRRERHLEARMHHGFRRQQQHRDRRDGERAEGHGGPVDQHREQHDPDHVIAALRRHFRAGEQQVERRRREREKRRPFLELIKSLEAKG